MYIKEADSYEIEKCYIRCADYPKPMIPHSFCFPELSAHIIYEKFAKAEKASWLRL